VPATGPTQVDLRKTLKQLELLAKKLGAKVRYEPIELPGGDVGLGRGGICRIAGRPVILCDARLPVIDKVSVLAEAIATYGVVPLHLPRSLRLKLQRQIARLSAHARPRAVPSSHRAATVTSLPANDPGGMKGR
jgi:hypothetical protein